MHTLPFGVPRPGCRHSQVSQAALPLLHIQLHPPCLHSCTSPPQFLWLASRGEGHPWTCQGWACPCRLCHSTITSSAKKVPGTESPGWAQALLSWLPPSGHRHQNRSQDGLEVTARAAAHPEGEEEGMFGSRKIWKSIWWGALCLCFYFGVYRGRVVVLDINSMVVWYGEISLS